MPEQLYSKVYLYYNYVEFITSRDPIMIESRGTLLNNK